MTFDELKYWGPQPYMVVITDEAGQPLGLMYTDGTFVECGSSNVGKERENNMVVVWDGSKPDPNIKGRSKGRLLPIAGPPYIDSTTALVRLMRVEDSEYADDETKERLKQRAARKAERNSKKGQSKAKIRSKTT